ncbi:MAG: hypothetical protein ABIR87_08370 [Sphingomicrobium sp.]
MALADAAVVAGRLRSAIDEPRRGTPCPAMIREAGQARRRAEHGSMYECGVRSGLVPLAAVITSYHWRMGQIAPGVCLGILERDARRPKGSPPMSGAC